MFPVFTTQIKAVKRIMVSFVAFAGSSSEDRRTPSLNCLKARKCRIFKSRKPIKNRNLVQKLKFCTKVEQKRLSRYSRQTISNF